MTITLEWWAIPLALFVFGFICAVADTWWDSRYNSGGYLGGIGNGCAGVIVCVICWVTALGICIGRWLA